MPDTTILDLVDDVKQLLAEKYLTAKDRASLGATCRTFYHTNMNYTDVMKHPLFVALKPDGCNDQAFFLILQHLNIENLNWEAFLQQLNNILQDPRFLQLRATRFENDSFSLLLLLKDLIVEENGLQKTWDHLLNLSTNWLSTTVRLNRQQLAQTLYFELLNKDYFKMFIHLLENDFNYPFATDHDRRVIQYGQSALKLAVENNDLFATKLLLLATNGPEVVNVEPLLPVAAKHSNLAMCKLLLQYGANVELDEALDIAKKGKEPESAACAKLIKEHIQMLPPSVEIAEIEIIEQDGCGVTCTLL